VNQISARCVGIRTGWTCAPLAAAALLAHGCQSPPSPDTQTGIREQIRGLTLSARERVFPALVNIRVVTVSYYGGQENKGGGTGSGTIVSPDGYVVTNAHVTLDGRRFFCTLADKQEISATMVGEDPATDLAVLKLNLSELKPGTSITVASWGNSDELQVGDNVLAMGSPFSLSRSVTLGIVSNTSRVFTSGFGSEELDEMELDFGQSTGSFTRWIQHDALINPGNSGGPLVNMGGEIVGVNTRGGSGMGFASPSNLVREVADQLVKHGEVARSTVGMSFKAISKTGIKEGVFVNTVNKDGPAAKGGVLAGDVVVKIDGTPINVRFAEEIPPLLRQLAGTPIGGNVVLSVLRDGKPMDFTLQTVKMVREKGDETLLRGWGVSVEEITDTIVRNRRLSRRDGALITGSRSGSPAELAEPKLLWGDIIRAIDGVPVKSMKDAVEIYRTMMTVDKPEQIPESVLIEIDRNGQSQVTLLKPRPPKKEDQPPELPKAWLGVQTQPVFRDLAKKLSPDGVAGFRVTRVYPGTVATTSGLVAGDIITSVNGEKMAPKGSQDAGQLQRKLRTMKPDDTVALKVTRAGVNVDLSVSLEKTRTTPDDARHDENKDFEINVREITFFDRDDERWPEDTQGVIITQVERMGWGGLAGLSGGDLIQKIHGQDVRNIDDFRKVMERLAKEQPTRVVFAVLRNNRSSFLFTEPEWKPKTKEEDAAEQKK
jgi:serine protease Do